MATTIQVSEETKESLDMIGNKGQTYDDILNQLIDERVKADEW